MLENRKFGRYLRRVREDRKLSLDAVEELSLSFPGRVTKSHLSRIENGQAEPTFPRMFALSRIYGVPISSLAERFESDLTQALKPAEVEGRPDERIHDEAEELRLQGRYEEALSLYDALVERTVRRIVGSKPTERFVDLLLRRIVCLVQLARYGVARDETEDLLGLPDLPTHQRAAGMYFFVTCCYYTGRFSIARLALEPTGRLIAELPDGSKLRAQYHMLEGNLLDATGDHPAAVVAFHEAVRALEARGDTFEVCRARINYASALMETGKSHEAKRMLLSAYQAAQSNGYDRHEAFALGTLGVLAYREGDLDAAESYCLKSNAVARVSEFVALLFRNCYYLWKIATVRGDRIAAKTHERSLRKYLTRVQGYLPEVIEFRRFLTGGEE